ncbi:Uncharacterised protein [Pannonibacter phragmitetus]|uniref:Hpt domain-containing protein n=1 Tax=Pannonibacter phragmitetus TaxID=121719 RepID=A0A378ZTH3_9HYPH|nr:hypothetical protein [Pannonibacter phragmitetus]SUB00536.1 Uncharacterised protein [Pannonibacter phragmitetus]
MISDEDLQGSGVEFVKPPTDLRKKVRVMSQREAAKFDPVKAAEAALERLSVQFDGWMHRETEQLFADWSAIEAEGLNGTTLAQLYNTTHNVKGQAQTLGYPLAGAVAASLCHLIEAVNGPEHLPLTLLRQHVDAIRAIVAEEARDEANPTGAALLHKLQEVTQDYIERTVPVRD